MFLRKVEFEKYKILENISIDYQKQEGYNTFPIATINGGGKSTLLQFIFVLLHCPFVEERRKYINNFFSHLVSEKDKITKLASFEIEYKGEIINLEYHFCNSKFKNLSFSSVLDLKSLKEKEKENNDDYMKISTLNKVEKDIKNQKISEAFAYRELRHFAKSRVEIEFIRDEESQLSFINRKRREIEEQIIPNEELNHLLTKAKTEKKKLEEALSEYEMNYLMHFNTNQNVLLLKSNVEQTTLEEISNKVFLASPNTQILQFFKKEEQNLIFSNSGYNSYESCIRENKENLVGLFTYEFSVMNLLVDAFKKARDEDFEHAIETGSYGDSFNKTREELNNFLSDKSISIDKEFKTVTFKLKNSDFVLPASALSHGELKKLSIYIWLKTVVEKDALVLMDEIDIGLHPVWQYEISKELQEWSKNSQFILATHSPQVISSSHYKNLVVLTRKENSLNNTTLQNNEAPLENDLNTIIKTIMGGEYIPNDLAKLRKEYRKLVDEGKVNTKEAKGLKKEILVFESENSSFFQEINFDLELQ